MSNPHEAAVRDAAARELTIELFPRVEGRAPEELFATRSIIGAKTIVVRHKDDHSFVVVPFEGRFSWAKLRRALGVNRTALPSPDEVLEVTGYEVGTISPVGARTGLPVIVDDRLDSDFLIMGSGDRNHVLVVRTADFIEAYGATVVALTPQE